jgi:[ribosomal protein S5]-alanine N-acetyltransferase
MRFLEGQKIYLRGIAKQDVNASYLSWLNDKETTKGLASGLFPTTLEALDLFVDKAIANTDVVMLAICDNTTNEHIGNIKIDHFDWVGRTCELGLLIGNKNYWGKGIGYEACRLTLTYAFHTLNIRKVLLAVYANNPAAIGLYRKLGFKIEGTLRQQVFDDGAFYDKHFMGIFAEELK